MKNKETKAAEAEDAIEPVAVKRETAARLLDCSSVTVWRLCRAGKLKTIKVGSDMRVTTESIRAYASAANSAAPA